MELKQIIECVVFSAQKALTPKEIREVLAAAAEKSDEAAAKSFKKSKEEHILQALEELEKEHAAANRSFKLVCVAGAWQFASLPEYSPWLKALYGEKNRPPRLSQPSLETLTIIAYRQPITRSEIEQIRGVSVDGVMQTLLERGLVEAVGRAEVVGRPITYGTTQLFLEYFGLRSLEELPAADELRRIPVQKPEALLTVDPGLATAPPTELAETPPAEAPAGEAAPVSTPDAPPTDAEGEAPTITTEPVTRTVTSA